MKPPIISLYNKNNNTNKKSPRRWNNEQHEDLENIDFQVKT
jgi:hypothetical protein